MSEESPVATPSAMGRRFLKGAAAVFVLSVLSFACSATSDENGNADPSAEGEAAPASSASEALSGPRLHWWNYVCASSASMWRTPGEIGNAPYELCGSSCLYTDAVYIYDYQYGERAAHVTALMGPWNRGGPPFPERSVSGYLNARTLCACPTNNPSSCSPYR
jgi:hypothetical protein